LQDQLKLQYIGYGSAPRFFINGVWGGAGGGGQIIAHMLFKHVTPPESSTVDVNTGVSIQTDGVLDVSEVMCTLIIPLEEADAIGQWMQRHVKAAKEMMEIINAGGYVPTGPLQ
jgi:hypothetical protein